MLKKNLKLKLALIELVLLAVVALAYFGVNTFGKELPYLEYSPYAALALFFIGTVVIFQVTIHKPLKTILKEMKLLLTGKKFHRVYTQKTDEIGILAHFFNEITGSLESIGKKLEEHKRFSTEINLAQKIQTDLLPTEAPPIPHLDIIAKTKAAAEIGGDSFDFFQQKDQSFFYIGDVTGHGIPAGLVMIMVDTLLTTFAQMSKNGQELLINVNKFLKPRLQANMFMTMLMMRWEHENKKMYFSGAGHEHLLHYHTDTGECEKIMGGGIAIGMLPDVSKMIKETEIDFKENDFIILYSDGITEGRNPNGEQYGLDRLVKFIKENAKSTNTSKDLFDAIAKDVTIFIEDHIIEDDMSLIVVKHTEEEKVARETTDWSKTEGAEESLINYKKEDIKETGIKKK